MRGGRGLQRKEESPRGVGDKSLLLLPPPDQTFLDYVEAGEKSCSEYMMTMATQFGAMTLSAETVRKMATSMPAEGDEIEAQAAAIGALDGALREAASEKGPDDPKRLVKDRLAERTRKVCFEMADIILR